jgi:hypothetical protein
MPLLQVPISRIAKMNRPELPAAIAGLAGSAALGLMMPGALPAAPAAWPG